MFHIYKSKFQLKDLTIKIKLLRILEKNLRDNIYRLWGEKDPTTTTITTTTTATTK